MDTAKCGPERAIGQKPEFMGHCGDRLAALSEPPGRDPHTPGRGVLHWRL